MWPIVLIDAHACQTCARCHARQVCKTRAIVQLEQGDLPIVDATRCRSCLACIPACPFGAVRRADRELLPPAL